MKGWKHGWLYDFKCRVNLHAAGQKGWWVRNEVWQYKEVKSGQFCGRLKLWLWVGNHVSNGLTS